MMIDVIRDVTERRRNESERRRLETELRQAQKMEALGQLAGGIAHDFNNLLAVILNYARFVSEGAKDLANVNQQELLEDVEQIIQAATSAASITRQLLAFSRKEVVHPEVLDVNQVMGGIEKIVQRTLGEDIQLKTDLQPNLWRVKLDRGQLEQVIVNLAINSRDAMPHGGRTTIATRNVHDAVEGDSPEARRRLVLEVSDTGCGISPDLISQIFDPFFTTKGEGTGLGLATVRGIVEQAGGTISVKSGLGSGTTFVIMIPVSDEPETSSDHPSDISAPCSGETILVVDDDDAVRRAVCRILAAAGYGVLEARGGREALLVHQRHGVALDLLLTDVVMPAMSGEELAVKMRKRQPQLPIVFMTGYATKAVVARAAGLTNTALLPKPFREAKLLSLVRSVFDSVGEPT
jgi:nitrogen-specific signal transduction histidine kinase/ActR/RegA family two-component response regulator